MKELELSEAIRAAGPCLIGEHRGSLVELVEFVDKKDGKAKSFVKATHLFEFGSGNSFRSIRIDQNFPANVETPNDAEIPFQRGKIYLIQLQGLEIQRGNLSGRISPMFDPLEIKIG